MYSDALRIMDQNMVKYMIDELKIALSQKDSEIERLRNQLAKYEAQD